MDIKFYMLLINGAKISTAKKNNHNTEVSNANNYPQL
ncbi:hypothetical protein J2W55_003323 [Mucilaginibacter pocheonensis]|uniref:Uncharacterized protein n=1 Tax=Mucilaginibacter pocheonensis TaxID=398050 RepID=A0ABU1TF34_9SPHI|nr:hypothetical protein [Mucilaginibacter pocheonensis]